jgi:hypothetical protein
MRDAGVRRGRCNRKRPLVPAVSVVGLGWLFLLGVIALTTNPTRSSAEALKGGVSIFVAKSGETSATLTYTTYGPYNARGRFSLAITRRNQVFTVYPARTAPGGPFANPVVEIGRNAPLTVRDLDGNGEPEVIVTVNTAADTCTCIDFIYSFDQATNKYTYSTFEYLGSQLRAIGPRGLPEFVTEDQSFRCVFASCVASWDPVRIMRFIHGRVVNETGQHLDLVLEERESIWSLISKPTHKGAGSEVNGLLASWLADSCRLPHECAAAWRRAWHLYRDGRLDPGSGYLYLQQVRQLLLTNGYATMITLPAAVNGLGSPRYVTKMKKAQGPAKFKTPGRYGPYGSVVGCFIQAQQYDAGILECVRPADDLAVFVNQARSTLAVGQGLMQIAARQLAVKADVGRLGYGDAWTWRCFTPSVGLYGQLKCGSKRGTPIYRCWSAATGLGCENTAGFGFWLSRAGFVTLLKPLAVR